MFPAGFEPATLCVWSTRDNHYTTGPSVQCVIFEQFKTLLPLLNLVEKRVRNCFIPDFRRSDNTEPVNE